MDILLKFMGNLFINTPLFALLPTLLFAFLYYQSKQKFIRMTAILWLLYALYELGMKFRILCGGECNIRVDLLVIYPLLLILSIIAFFKIIRWHSKREKNS